MYNNLLMLLHADRLVWYIIADRGYTYTYIYNDGTTKTRINQTFLLSTQRTFPICLLSRQFIQFYTFVRG